jgi:hypothetical protein
MRVLLLPAVGVEPRSSIPMWALAEDAPMTAITEVVASVPTASSARAREVRTFIEILLECLNVKAC